MCVDFVAFGRHESLVAALTGGPRVRPSLFSLLFLFGSCGLVFAATINGQQLVQRRAGGAPWRSRRSTEHPLQPQPVLGAVQRRRYIKGVGESGMLRVDFEFFFVSRVQAQLRLLTASPTPMGSV